MEETFIHIVLAGFTVFACGGFVVLYLWRAKSRSDQKAYGDILKQPKVKTCYNPDEYNSIREKQ